jgi:hypothetical protein
MKEIQIKNCATCPFFRYGKQIFDCYYPINDNYNEIRTVNKFMPYYDYKTETHSKCPLKTKPLNIKHYEN